MASLNNYLDPYNTGATAPTKDTADTATESFGGYAPEYWKTAAPGGSGDNSRVIQNPLGSKYADYVRNYWAPDRRAAILRELDMYDGNDRQSLITQYQNMSDADLWAGNAAARPGGSGTNSNGTLNAGQIGQAWMNYANGLGRRPTSQDVADFLSKNSGWGLTAGGSKGNKVTVGGQTFKLIGATSDPNAAFAQWLDITNGEGGGPTNPNEFTDPWGSRFEQAITDRLNSLLSGPNRDALNNYVSRLLSTDEANQRNVQDFVGSMRKRIDELKQTPYTAGDEAVMRAKSLDALERRRQQTIKNQQEQVYARGFAPTSGLVEQATQDVNQQFEQARTGIESNLLESAIQESQRRKDQALGLEQLVQQALSGGDLASLSLIAQTAQLEDQVYQDRQAREREYLSTMGLPLDLMMQRAQLGNQTAGLSANPSSIMSSILALLSQSNQNRQITNANAQNNMLGAGSILSLLFPNGLAGGR